jgi:hypothetical protein
MSGVKGRSGPPGNLNRAITPWRSFWKRRALKPADKWVLGLLDEYAAGLASDKPDMSETERRTAQIAETARGCVALIFAEVRKSGFLRQDKDGWDLQPGAKELARFLNLELTALRMLGLDRRQKQVPDLDMYLRERYGHQAADATADTSQAAVTPERPENAGQGGENEAPR